MADTRRRILQAAGGFGAGLLFTPVPWRLLGDTALWTQNWSWLPRVPHGPMTSQVTRCSLCPAGCPVRIQLTGGVPTGVWPSGQPLCPAGLVGHHLRYHPNRLLSVTRGGQPAALPQLLDALRQRLATMHPRLKVAVLDLAPGRTASLLHRRALAQVPNGVYLEAPLVEGGTAEAVSELLETPSQLAIDLERTRTLFAVGTPVAEGWASPRFSGRARRPFQLIQAGSQRSRSGDVADTWLPIRPGGETELLLGVAQVLLEKGLESEQARQCEDFRLFQALIQARGPVTAPVRDIALRLASARPAAVVADGDPANGPLHLGVRKMAAALNVLLGAAGAEGGYVSRSEPPAPPGWSGVGVTPLEEVEDGSLGLLVLDDPLPGGALPWALVEKKLASDALVVASTWASAGIASRAEWLAPAPVYLETTQDAPAGPDQAQAVFRVSKGVVEPPRDSIDGVALLTSALGTPVSLSEALEERAAAIHAAGRGDLCRAGASQPAPVDSVTASEFWDWLRDGGSWRDSSPATNNGRPVRLLPAGSDVNSLAGAADSRRPARAYGWRQAAVSPLLGKLWTESEVRNRPGGLLEVRG